MKASITALPISLISAGSDPNIPDPMIAPIPVAIQARSPIFFFSISGLLSILACNYSAAGSGIASTNLVLFMSGCSSLIAPSTGHSSTHAPQYQHSPGQATIGCLPCSVLGSRTSPWHVLAHVLHPMHLESSNCIGFALQGTTETVSSFIFFITSYLR